MYKIFMRPRGDSSAPDENSYEVLNIPLGTTVHVLFDPAAETVNNYIQSPSLTMSAEEAGTCTFTMLYGHPFYSEVKPYETEILVYEYDTCIWIGRIIDIDTDLYLSKSITAEGALAVLNDIYTEGKNSSSDVPRSWYLSDIFEVYIEPYLTAISMPTLKKSYIMEFEIDYNYLDPNHELALTFEDGFDYCSIKDILSQITTRYGGYFYVEPMPYPGSPNTIYAYIKYSKGIPDKLISSQLACTFTAKMNTNISDVSQDVNIDQFATVIRPLGKRKKVDNPQQGDIEIERYDGSACAPLPTSPIPPYEIQNDQGYFYIWEFVIQYGWIEKTIVYDDIGPNEHDSSETRIARELGAEAAKDLAQCLLQVTGTTVKFNAFVDSDATPRSITQDIPAVPRIFDGVKVMSTVHGINITTPLQILDLTIDMFKPQESEISLSITNYKLISKLIK